MVRLAGLIVFVALGLWGFASSRLTYLWLHGANTQTDDELVDLRGELRSVREQLSDIASSLTKLDRPLASHADNQERDEDLTEAAR
jgi:hypothetical protein